MRLTLLGVAFLAVLPARPVCSQPVADTLITWRGYATESRCQVQVYPSSDEKTRPHTLVIRELAANTGPSTLTDARYLAEHIGRHLGLDPARVTWVFHWGSFSFDGAARRPRKSFFLRATFRRTAAGALTSPAWRVVTRPEVEVLTAHRYVPLRLRTLPP
ncbi:MAG: hypothetical protein AAGI71_11770 [Bacteroidota bacterium]